jgi:hypothetical protein
MGPLLCVTGPIEASGPSAHRPGPIQTSDPDTTPGPTPRHLPLPRIWEVTQKEPPMPRTAHTRRTDVFGSPGAYALVLARKAMLRAAAATGGVLAATLATAWVLTATDLPLWAAAFPATAAFAAGVVVRGAWGRAEKAFVGARSEKIVAKALLAATPDVVVHGALLGAGGDCDHAVLGPVVAVVETKTGSGKVSLDKNGLRAGRRVIMGDPLAQVRRQAAALGKKAGLWTEAVVCITEMENAPFVANGVTVCSPRDLPAVLASMPRVCTTEKAHRIAFSISPRP